MNKKIQALKSSVENNNNNVDINENNKNNDKKNKKNNDDNESNDNSTNNTSKNNNGNNINKNSKNTKINNNGMASWKLATHINKLSVKELTVFVYKIDFMDALKLIEPSVSLEDLKHYEMLEEKYNDL